jgi:hypothetical protein
VEVAKVEAFEVALLDDVLPRCFLRLDPVAREQLAEHHVVDERVISLGASIEHQLDEVAREEVPGAAQEAHALMVADAASVEGRPGGTCFRTNVAMLR